MFTEAVWWEVETNVSHYFWASRSWAANAPEFGFQRWWTLLWLNRFDHIKVDSSSRHKKTSNIGKTYKICMLHITKQNKYNLNVHGTSLSSVESPLSIIVVTRSSTSTFGTKYKWISRWIGTKLRTSVNNTFWFYDLL